jgi:engulfment/cell motility protein 1
MMATAFEAKEHHITLCLRDESDRVVTTNNLKHRVSGKSELK